MIQKNIELQHYIKVIDLNYAAKKKNYSFDRYLLPKVFLRNAYDRKLEDADQEQSMLAN